jgi:polyisoprenoid-binding protein YceI
MEAHMYTALKAGEPQATYITAHFDRLPESVISGETVETTGRLNIAGVERQVRMTVSSDRLPDGTRRARGTVPILMTDFGIKPPRPWGGILRTADKVLIQFEIFISPTA